MTDNGHQPEGETSNYLQANPAYEMNLWQEWVVHVCRCRKLASPTGREWDSLMSNWHHGKMPIKSVDELESMRKTLSTEARPCSS
jgi:hypothetical protein